MLSRQLNRTHVSCWRWCFINFYWGERESEWESDWLASFLFSHRLLLNSVNLGQSQCCQLGLTGASSRNYQLAHMAQGYYLINWSWVDSEWKGLGKMGKMSEASCLSTWTGHHKLERQLSVVVVSSHMPSPAVSVVPIWIWIVRI